MSKRRDAVLDINKPVSPPHWALLERELFRVISKACREFYDWYFDKRGYLLCIPHWSARDGADDAAENMGGWTIFHAMGGSDVILQLYKQGFEGHLLQYSEAKTVEVPFARDGMYYREFPVVFDWIHNGEGFSVFYNQGLSNPDDQLYQSRMRRYSGFYMNEDPKAPNYDPEHKIIRSTFTGSRGPMFREADSVDWSGDRYEIEDRFWPPRGERSFDDILTYYAENSDSVGDSPVNLPITSLPMHCYMFSREEKYKRWILEYVDAWVERCEANGGIIPTNIGLDGTIGGECNGKWYGGVYGWNHTRVLPPGLYGTPFDKTEPTYRHHPVSLLRSPYGFANALLLTGDQNYVDVWRAMIEKVNENKKKIDGKMMYPHMYGDDGWYHFTPEPFSEAALEIYYWTMDRKHLDLIPDNEWISYLEGNNPEYPVKALQRDLNEVRERMEKIYNDTSTPDTRQSEDPNELNPACIDGLTQLMLGGIPMARRGCPLHCRLRYFDPEKRRAGVPEDVAALVEKMSADEVVFTLVNVNQIESRTLIVQSGAYGEHQIVGISAEGKELEADASHFTVRLGPGAGSQINLKVKRYANTPTLDFPF